MCGINCLFTVGDADAKKSLEAIQAFEQLTCLLANRKSTKAQMVHRFSVSLFPISQAA